LANKSYKSLLQDWISSISTNPLIINKIYNITQKKSQRMGRGSGKLSYLSTHYYGNKPLWLNNNIVYNKYKLLYLNYLFIKVTKKYNFISFK
jgi:hypothetical protein